MDSQAQGDQLESNDLFSNDRLMTKTGFGSVIEDVWLQELMQR